MLAFQGEDLSAGGHSMAAGQDAADPGLAARAGSPADFRVYSTVDQIANARFYFVESTAPDSVEQGFDPGGNAPEGLTYVDADQAVEEIAEFLTPALDPQADANLVVMVHGFNTPRDRALEFYAKALDALVSDQNSLFSDPARRTVCVGYRWPSERIGSVLGSSLSALPFLPLVILAASALAILVASWIIVALLRLLAVWQADLLWRLELAIMMVGFLLIFTIAILALLRAIVYFRDVYRATNYGVPDLVEVIRQIDREAVRRLEQAGEKGRDGASAAHRAVVHWPQHGRVGRHERDPDPLGRVREGRHPDVSVRTAAAGNGREGAGRRGRRGPRADRTRLQFDAVRPYFPRHSGRGPSRRPRQFPRLFAEAIPQSLSLQQRRR